MRDFFCFCCTLLLTLSPLLGTGARAATQGKASGSESTHPGATHSKSTQTSATQTSATETRSTATGERLPKDVSPEDYRITLIPNLNSLTFQGSETIRIRVQQATRQITLNARELTLKQARLIRGPIATLQTNPEQQRATLTFPEVLQPGTYDLELGFSGKINPHASGLYYAQYPTAQGQKRLLATQMEPIAARRMFPSWDEPAYRATFQLTVVLPQDFKAVSNMPIVQETPLGKALKRVTFARTPKMSSYLVVLVAGNLETIATTAGNVDLRIVTTAGKQEQGRYALASSQALLAYYNDYFGVPYPLPKLDMIAVPGGFRGAMENWGGITYNESGLLFDPARSSQRAQQGIFGVIAHEMAHQWFGNLVTMAWWDDLWLNEGFASWMGSKATDRLNPQWNVWLRASQEKEAAMSSDARRTTHPIQQPITDERQSLNAFDEITYLKGQALLRMLETYLGEAVFREGIRAYMRQYQYRNTTTAELWQALEQRSGKPIRAIAKGWVEQPGFPVVTVQSTCENNQRRLTLTQERFTINDPNPQPLSWQIPIALTRFTPQPQSFSILLTDKTTTIPVGTCQEGVKLNADNVGYYRVQYDATLFQDLQRRLPQLPVSDRVNLLSDAWAFVQAARSPASRYLALVEAVRSDTNLAIWEQILTAFSTIDQLQRQQPGRAQFQQYACSRLRPLLAQLGWTFKPQENPTMTLLRSRVIAALGQFGDAETIAEARRQFQRFLANPAALDANLRDAILPIVGRYSDLTTYERLHQLGRQAKTLEERARYYRAMQGAIDPALAEKTLQIALTDELPPPLAVEVLPAVAYRGEQPQLVWNFAQQHLPKLTEKLGDFERNSYVPDLLAAFSEANRADELEAYAKAHLPPEANTEVARSAEQIRFNAKLKQQLLPQVDRWIQTNLQTSQRR